MEERTSNKGRFRPRDQKSEFDSKVIDVRRVARVMAGGRRFNFRVAVVVGDRNGRVGVGMGKGADTALAIEKATRFAKKNLIKIKMNKDFSIPRQVEAKHASARLIIKPAKAGSGLVAGSSVRNVLELVGLRNINAKILSKSKNTLNNAYVAIAALKKIK